MEITELSQLDLNKTYTYADYLRWKFKERVELIKGKILEMSPAPNTKHQKISLNFTIQLHRYFENTGCGLFIAPFDVRLPRHNERNEEILTVVQPDLCVICDQSKLDEKGCHGAPDLIVEILSPGNARKELKSKFDLYEKAGVTEYWVVNPSEETVLVNVLENGCYKTLRPVVDDEIRSVTFPELKINSTEIFK